MMDQIIEFLLKTRLIQSVKFLSRLRISQQPYSVSQALDIKHRTIGAYAKILAEILLPTETSRSKFWNKMMKTQYRDDICDMSRDYLSQVNPFVALLHEERLWDEFCKRVQKAPFLTRLIDVNSETFRVLRITNKRLSERFNDIVAAYTTADALPPV